MKNKDDYLNENLITETGLFKPKLGDEVDYVADGFNGTDEEDKREGKAGCRSKEGLEADLPMRALSYGQIGENILDSDDLSENVLNETGEEIPHNFIKVEH